jgi:putative transposase
MMFSPDLSMTADLIKVKLHRPVEGEIKTVTIKRDVNHRYVCFSVERDSVALPESSEDIDMDVGLDSFAALSNGMEIDNPRYLKRGMAHLRRAQRQLSRRKRGSHRRRKAATLVAKAHRKIRNQRAAFHHDLSRWLVERYGLIAVEDLNIKDFRAEYWPARSTTPDGTLSLPNSGTRLQAPGESW